MLTLHSIILCLLSGCLCHENFENVALRKRCKQDSDLADIATCNKAVDGNTHGVYENSPHTCMHTAAESLNPWWEVDLGQPYPVYKITLWAREKFLHRMKGSVITVDGHHCYTISSQPADREINIHCASGVINGQVVRISKQSSRNDGDNTLNMCEVQVWGCSRLFWGPRCENKCKCPDGGTCDKVTGHCSRCEAGKYGRGCQKYCGHGCIHSSCNAFSGHCECKSGWLPPLCHLENVALGKRCKQDSFLDDFVTCNKAVDGITTGIYENNPRTCIHTSADSLNPWWEVDLGQTYPVYQITLWARESFLHRMTGSVITVDGHHCYTFPSQPTNREINIHCASGVINGNVVRVSKQSSRTGGDNTLNLCEIQVWSCGRLSWGPHCENKCKCSDGGICDKITGHCSRCVAGKYGRACKKDCGHGCKNLACNAFSGQCECNPGWLPPLCHLENVAVGKPCKQDSDYYGSGICKTAVDGNTLGVYENNPQTCMHTSADSLNPWWEVDLGQKYPVQRITLWARELYLRRMTGSVITVDGHHCYMISSQPTHREININCAAGAISGSVVRVSKESHSNHNQENTLNMCEVQVWSCSQQFWGPHCENKCGCSDYSCDKINGHCPKCDAGKYGDACNKKCGVGCKNKECNKDTGHCQCKPGFLPPLCDLSCNRESWGPQCKNKCRCPDFQCNKVTGECLKCDAGKYGDICNKNCGPGCKNKVCNKTTGHCECKPGWLPPLCRQVDKCDAGKYGDTCNETCGPGCKYYACNKVTGHCECLPGYLPPFCRIENVAFDKKCNMNLKSRNKHSCRKGINGDTQSSKTNCIRSSGIESPWWEVDLGRNYPVYSITLWAEEGYKHRLEGLKITVDKWECYTFTYEPVTSSNEININCSLIIEGRVVRLSFESFSPDIEAPILDFCELQVWSCGKHFWGDHCENKCEICSDGQTCNQVDGSCCRGSIPFCFD